MAVPYRRKSKSKSRMQRAANMKYTTAGSTNCAGCGEPKMPHFACGACGVYNGRQVREVVEY
ncbi:MAG: 50S ribosomal protein L32 [Deltaproteobacteria bacterium]|nr:50S ribosomal protein L32 [Deltaproteobacteria bacterium]